MAAGIENVDASQFGEVARKNGYLVLADNAALSSQGKPLLASSGSSPSQGYPDPGPTTSAIDSFTRNSLSFLLILVKILSPERVLSDLISLCQKREANLQRAGNGK